MLNGEGRTALARMIEEVLEHNQLVVLKGPRGLGQRGTLAGLSCGRARLLSVSGDWRRHGYLAGFQELIDLALAWSDENRPTLITRYEQTLKRILPHLDSPHFKTPRDLTNTSDAEERTRFYHHEYQNKLLVGVSEFVLAFLENADDAVVLAVDDASRMSPTALSLLQTFLRSPESHRRIRFILTDYDSVLFFPAHRSITCPEFSYEELADLLNLEETHSNETAHQIHVASHGNPTIARALVECGCLGLPVIGYLDYRAIVDLYLASRDIGFRRTLLRQYIAADCESDDYIAIRNHETFSVADADAEHEKRHASAMQAYEAGSGPLVTFHALAIRDKYKRLNALVAPGEVLKNIGLYDTWFSVFAECFADPELRLHGSGDDPANAAFINASFVLYALGCGRTSSPYLEEFHERFPRSRFTPTLLYAQSMTYGRYLQPVNLPLAERYAIRNLETIDAQFRATDKYHYIKVFAENAYAYIKARQGKYDEALELCKTGNQTMQEVYGEERFRLHQSILTYNTAQVYEIVHEYDLAESYLRKAIASDPYYGEYYNDLGNLLSKRPGRETEALAAYQTAIELCPPYYEAYLNRSMLHARLGNHDAAMRDLERVVEIKPTEWRAFLQMGTMWLIMGMPGDALESFRQAERLHPGDADVACNMGLAYAQLSQPEESIDRYRAALAANSHHAIAHGNLAVELHAIGKNDEALRHAARAVELSDDPDFSRNLAYIKSVVLARA